VHVVLLGSMGVGKSTIGAGLAARLGRPLRDSDADLAATRGLRGRELAAREGVEALHRWEIGHLRRALSSAEPAVIAAAASVIDDPGCRAALGGAYVVWLRAPAPTLAARLSPGDHRRPLTAPGGPTGARDVVEAVAAVEARRAPRYRAVADLVVDTSGATPEEVALRVFGALPDGLARIGARAGTPTGGPHDLPRPARRQGVRSRGRAPG
jgi:shikimate kinase